MSECKFPYVQDQQRLAKSWCSEQLEWSHDEGKLDTPHK